METREKYYLSDLGLRHAVIGYRDNDISGVPENTDREFGPLEAIPDNYEKLVLSADALLKVNRGGIRQKNIVDFLLET